MKKILLLLTVSLITLFSFSQANNLDSRVVKKCGYMTNEQAVRAAKQTSFNPFNEELGTLITNLMDDGSYCFWQVVNCYSATLPGLPQPRPIPYSLINKPTDTRKLRKCGFTSEYAATQAVISVILADDETAVSCVEKDPYNLNRWCYDMTIYCGPMQPVANIYNFSSSNIEKLLPLLLPKSVSIAKISPKPSSVPTKLLPPAYRYFNLSEVKEMKDFVTKEGARIRESGWKFSDLKISIQNDKFYVVMAGMTKPPGGWSGCSAVNWGQPYASCPGAMNDAISSMMLNYTNQGYNCVCRAGRNETFWDGEWLGNVWCETVTAKVSALCDCIPN